MLYEISLTTLMICITTMCCEVLDAHSCQTPMVIAADIIKATAPSIPELSLSQRSLPASFTISTVDVVHLSLPAWQTLTPMHSKPVYAGESMMIS